MNTFLEKLNKQAEIRNELDNYIWSIFYKYIKDFKINFSDPDSWSYELGDDSIVFDGFDGCMGCYDNMNITIDLKYYDDYELQRKLKLNKQWDEQQGV